MGRQPVRTSEQLRLLCLFTVCVDFFLKELLKLLLGREMLHCSQIFAGFAVSFRLPQPHRSHESPPLLRSPCLKLPHTSVKVLSASHSRCEKAATDQHSNTTDGKACCDPKGL